MTRFTSSIVLFCICYNLSVLCLYQHWGCFLCMCSLSTMLCNSDCCSLIISFCATYHRYVWKRFGHNVTGEFLCKSWERQMAAWKKKPDNTHSTVACQLLDMQIGMNGLNLSLWRSGTYLSCCLERLATDAFLECVLIGEAGKVLYYATRFLFVISRFPCLSTNIPPDHTLQPTLPLHSLQVSFTLHLH